ncbi:hypothetical protein GCM10023259_067350 [Thermocatellispora tengchongensis]
MAVGGETAEHLGGQARLADPRRAGDHDTAARPVLGETDKMIEFPFSPRERPAFHLPPSPPVGWYALVRVLVIL